MIPETGSTTDRFRFQKTIYTGLQDIQAVFPVFRKEIEVKRTRPRPGVAALLGELAGANSILALPRSATVKFFAK